MYNLLFKRIIDIVLAFTGLILTLPITIIVIIWLSIVNKGTPFFIQKRPGKDNKIFKIIKFKSMNDIKDSQGLLLDNKKRLTIAGKFLRRMSIDEIPQLFNVLKGEMSIIGPRPLKVDYLQIYSDIQKRRHEVRPGITGWAQVNGRTAISHTKKFEFDVWYVDNISLFLDIKIIYLTILKVIKREGISKEGVDINIPFNGTN